MVNRPSTKTKEDAIAFIKNAERNNAADKLAYWGITLPEIDEVSGSICLWNFSDDRKTAEVGYELSVAAQGKGYMTEAMQAVLEFGFTKLGLTTVEAFTQSNNAASIRLLGKFGFDLLVNRKDEGNKLNAVYALIAESF